MVNYNRDRRERRKKRISANIKGRSDCPRISIYRSNKHIYAQAIDDVKQQTIVAYSDKLLKLGEKLTKTQKAKEVGKKLADLLIKNNVQQAVFDRGRFGFGGRVRALAEGIREGGIRI